MALIRHRITARVLLQAPTGRFLLLLTHWSPGSGLKPRWVAPGGGIEGSESPAVAASRELFEETGLRLAERSLGAPIAELDFRQEWKTGDYETGKALIFHQLAKREFSASSKNWTSAEQRDILQQRWWDAEQLIESGEVVGPPGLAELMLRLAKAIP